jgi:hypothetical protein
MISNKIKIIIIILFLLLSTGTVWATSSWNVTLQIINPIASTVRWAVPEGRVGTDGSNWDTTFFLKVTPTNDSDKTPLFVMSELKTTDVSGEYNTPISFDGLSDGTYDVSFKGHQHLSVKLNDVALASGNNSFNFTQTDNSIFLGPVRLLAGDINGDGLNPATLGDNVINSVDLSIMLRDLDLDDPTNRSIRANLNQDPVVNSVDLSLLLKNLDKQGDY